MSSSDNLHIVDVFVMPLPIVDVWPVGCCLVYFDTASGTATSQCWFFLKLEEGTGMLILFCSLFFCCWTIMAKG